MTKTVTLRAAMMSTALVAPLALAPAAQAQNNEVLLTQEQVANLVPGCQELVRVTGDVIDEVDTRRQLAAIAERDVEADCAIAVQRLEGARGTIEAASTTDRETIYATLLDEIEAEVDVAATAAAADTATLEVERQAVAVGRVAVTQEAADVDVQATAPEVEVTPGAPEVDVSAMNPEIVVRQKQPNIRLQMPQPTISIDMPAPDIIVTMPNPEVAVTAGRPQVDVRQAQPEVAVRVPEPEVDVAVEARIVNPNTTEGQQLITEAQDGPATELDVATDEDIDVNIAQADPTVTVNEAAGEPTINIAESQPNIRYEPAEPNVEIVGQPQIEFNQVGEPNVQFRTAGQQQQEQQQADLAALEIEETDVDLAAEEVGDVAVEAGQEVEQTAEFTATELTAETEGLLRATDPGLASAQEGQIAVRDILGYDVVNADGAELGDAERVVMNNGQLYLVVEHGGFLGIGGEEVALPMERVTLRGEQLVLEGLTEDDLAAMPSYNREAEQELGTTDMVDMGVL